MSADISEECVASAFTSKTTPSKKIQSKTSNKLPVATCFMLVSYVLFTSTLLKQWLYSQATSADF
jgi:hypothetical protein